MPPTAASEVQELMLEFVNLMIREGPDSPGLDRLLNGHRGNAEFVRLAELARRLKRSARPEANPFARADPPEAGTPAEQRAAAARHAAGG